MFLYRIPVQKCFTCKIVFLFCIISKKKRKVVEFQQQYCRLGTSTKMNKCSIVCRMQTASRFAVAYHSTNVKGRSGSRSSFEYVNPWRVAPGGMIPPRTLEVIGKCLFLLCWSLAVWGSREFCCGIKILTEELHTNHDKVCHHKHEWHSLYTLTVWIDIGLPKADENVELLLQTWVNGREYYGSLRGLNIDHKSNKRGYLWSDLYKNTSCSSEHQ